MWNNVMMGDPHSEVIRTQKKRNKLVPTFRYQIAMKMYACKWWCCAVDLEAQKEYFVK